MRIQNNDITPSTSQNCICTLLTADTILGEKILFAIDYFVSFSREKVSSALTVTSFTPTKSNVYLANSLGTVVNDPNVYSFLTFHLMSLFHCVGRSKGLVQALFTTRPVFTLSSC